MKVKDDPTSLLDVIPTHFRCIEDDEMFSLDEYYGHAVENPSLDELVCPLGDDDEDHPVEFIHESETPLASPSARKSTTVVGGNPWFGLDPFDEEHYHYGRRTFTYTLDESA